MGMNMSITRKAEHRQTAPPFKASRTRGGALNDQSTHRPENEPIWTWFGGNILVILQPVFDGTAKMKTSDSRLTEHRHLLSKCRPQERKSHPKRQEEGINEYIHGNNPQKKCWKSENITTFTTFQTLWSGTDILMKVFSHYPFKKMW